MTFDTQPRSPEPAGQDAAAIIGARRAIAAAAADVVLIAQVTIETTGAMLLGSERIGVTLSEEYQLAPEQSTDALIAHHPEANYFST